MMSVVGVLARQPGDEPAHWVRTHVARGPAGSVGKVDLTGTRYIDQYRIRIEADGVPLGSLGASGIRKDGPPGREQTRIMALAADQVGLSLRRDQLRATTNELAVARQADSSRPPSSTRSRTTCERRSRASERPPADLADPDVARSTATVRAAATVIDAEAARLDRLGGRCARAQSDRLGRRSIQTSSRTTCGVVEPALDRLRPRLGGAPIQVDLPHDLPPVLADEVLLDTVVTDLLENVANHARRRDARGSGPAPPSEAGTVRLTVEDGGPGVPARRRPTLFDRFRAWPGPREGSRRGLGIGLSVVRGLVEAMVAAVTARTSPLGGLAIDGHGCGAGRADASRASARTRPGA